MGTLKHYAAGGRNIEKGPHADDGRVNPLKSGLVRGFNATQQEPEAVVAFLEALTDHDFISNPRFSDPWPQTRATIVHEEKPDARMEGALLEAPLTRDREQTEPEQEQP